MANNLERLVRSELALVGSFSMPVKFAFTERTGGVSQPPYTSLNLGSHVGDDIECVLENRRRVLSMLGCEQYADRLLVPNQVHGDEVAIVTDANKEPLDEVRKQIAEGADAIVCIAKDVPVMLCYADCVPIVIVCEKGFAVIHSGWRGTYAKIAAKAARILMDLTNTAPQNLQAWIGPHILGDEYEVSFDLMQKFSARFGIIENADSCLLDMSACICKSLEEVGVPPCSIHDAHLSTMRLNSRFFSYRLEEGKTGRHAAVAVMQ